MGEGIWLAWQAMKSIQKGFWDYPLVCIHLVSMASHDKYSEGFFWEYPFVCIHLVDMASHEKYSEGFFWEYPFVCIHLVGMASHEKYSEGFLGVPLCLHTFGWHGKP